jgi:hypothetical protein
LLILSLIASSALVPSGAFLHFFEHDVITRDWFHWRYNKK